MSVTVVTGVSGSGRVELLEELSRYIQEERGMPVVAHDVGRVIAEECQRLRIPITDQRILNADRSLLQALRASALCNVQREIQENPEALHLVGVHATFRWKSRLIPGVSYADLIALSPSSFVNAVRNVAEVVGTNQDNPKWANTGAPDLRDTQEWMVEEEFATEVLADVLGRPMYIVAREHNVENLAKLLVGGNKRIYLSYPITAVRKENPKLLDQVQGPILRELEKLFVVFNPLAIKDMSLTYENAEDIYPHLKGQLTPEAKELIKARTIDRDYQFIDQSDAVVVYYLTEKLSPGVMGEINYAHRTQKPVFMCFPKGRSPFLEDATDTIESDLQVFMRRLEEFSRQ